MTAYLMPGRHERIGKREVSPWAAVPMLVVSISPSEPRWWWSQRYRANQEAKVQRFRSTWLERGFNVEQTPTGWKATKRGGSWT